MKIFGFLFRKSLIVHPSKKMIEQFKNNSDARKSNSKHEAMSFAKTMEW